MKSLKDLHRENGYRIKVLQLGESDEGDRGDQGDPDQGTEPIVEVKMQVPLSDARRMGDLMYQWVEVVAVDNADQAEKSAPPDEYVIWCGKYNQWWGPDAQGYTPNLTEAGVYTRQEAERHAEPRVDEVRPVSTLLNRFRSGTVGALLRKMNGVSSASSAKENAS